MQSKNKSPRNKTLSLSPSEAKKYLGRCLSADRPLPPRPADRTIVGDSFAVMEQLPKPHQRLPRTPFYRNRRRRICRLYRKLDRKAATAAQTGRFPLRLLRLEIKSCHRSGSEKTLPPAKPHHLAAGKGARRFAQLEKRHGRHLVCHLFRPLHLQS